jgi:hypothetical protein
LMEWILIGVYSPSGKVTAESITQKWKQWWSPLFRKKINATKNIPCYFIFKHDPNTQGFWA